MNLRVSVAGAAVTVAMFAKVVRWSAVSSILYAGGFGLALPAPAVTVTLDPTSATVATGDTFDLAIYLTGDGGANYIYYMNSNFGYDSAVIKPVAVSFGSILTSLPDGVLRFSPTTWSIYNNYGTFDVIALGSGIAYLLGHPIFANDLYATISFKAVGPGSTLIEGYGMGYGYCCAPGDPGPDFTLQGPAQITVASAVPLPAALPLFACGLGLLGLASWRKRRKAAA